MDAFCQRFKHVLVGLLTATVAAIIALAMLDLLWMIIQDVVTPPVVLLGVDELLDLFGFVLVILVGIELLETIRCYLKEHLVRLEVVLDVALIAMARKVIVLKMDGSAPWEVAGIAAVVVALGAARYLVTCRAAAANLSRPSETDPASEPEEGAP